VGQGKGDEQERHLDTDKRGVEPVLNCPHVKDSMKEKKRSRVGRTGFRTKRKETATHAFNRHPTRGYSRGEKSRFIGGRTGEVSGGEEFGGGNRSRKL